MQGHVNGKFVTKCVFIAALWKVLSLGLWARFGLELYHFSVALVYSEGDTKSTPTTPRGTLVFMRGFPYRTGSPIACWDYVTFRGIQ